MSLENWRKIPEHKRKLFELYDWIVFTRDVLKENDWQNYTSFMYWVKKELAKVDMSDSFIPKKVTNKNYVATYFRLAKTINLDSFKFAAIITDDTLCVKRGKYTIDEERAEWT